MNWANRGIFLEQPLTSIIIPVYNGENYLSGAIDSALAQSYSNIEVIVVNDGSTDNTEQIALSYGGHIRYYCKENGGVSSALNLGIEKMNGEYFSWLAHDDVYYPHKITNQMAVLKQAQDKTAVVHGNYDLFDVKRSIKSTMRQEDSYSTNQLINSVFPLTMSCVHGSTPLIHKDHFERVGVFDENLPLTQDYDLLFRIMRGQKTLFLTEPLLCSRLHGQSGKNMDNHFGDACAKQYEHFADTLTYQEVLAMFKSPRAFYCRIAAMMNARADTPKTKVMMERVWQLPDEPQNSLTKRLTELSGGVLRKVCIFCAGYHGNVLKFELEHRGIAVNYFYDNDESRQGKTYDGVTCVTFGELAEHKNNILAIVAADVSDAIVAQLKDSGFPYITTKKKLDALILECPPTI